MTRPLRRAKKIARLKDETMRKYYVEVAKGKRLHKYFWSYSRNARKHLRDNVQKHEIGVRCVVYKSDGSGDVVSACEYLEDGTIKYLNW